MEKKILQKLDVHTRILRTDLNGKGVKIPAIARRISSSIKVLNGVYNPIIILIDRENRIMTVDRIIQELYKELINNGVKDNLIIGVADRMIENWILADWDSFIKQLDSPPQKNCASFEGKKGKSIIKKYSPHYQETTDGPRLFYNSRSSIIKQNSDSFNKFITPIMALNYNCYWLTK